MNKEACMITDPVRPHVDGNRSCPTLTTKGMARIEYATFSAEKKWLQTNLLAFNYTTRKCQ